MSIETSTDIYSVIRGLIGLPAQLTGVFATDVEAALVMPSPVDTVVAALEALYAAVLGGGYAEGQLTVVASACGRLAFLVTSYQWNGKTQRAADILAAMNAVVSGTAPDALTSAPAVDDPYKPAPAPIAPAPAIS